MEEKEYKYITYLIGSMQIPGEGDRGETKREKVEEELLLRNVFAINPTTMETIRTGFGNIEMGEKFGGWVAGGCWDLFKQYMDLIWKGKKVIKDNNIILLPGDKHYIEMSDWITAIYNKGDEPCGTYGEACYAYFLNKSVYLITDVPKKELKRNFLGWILGSNGEVFRTKNEYFEFIDKKYKLKRREK